MFWSRSRQEVWRKGDTSGDRQFVREASYDCDGDTLLFVVEQEGRGACHTGERTCFFRAFGDGRRRSADDPPEPGRVPGPGPRPHRRPGVARAAGRPRHAGRRVRPPVPRRRARASCSSRSSTASAGAAGRSSGRRAAATLVARDGRARGRPAGRLPDGIPLDQGVLAARRGAAGRVPLAGARRPAAAARRARRLPRLRRGARGRAPARRRPTTTSACPTPSCRSSASWPPSTTGASGSRSSPTPTCSASPTDAEHRPRLRRGGGPARAAGRPTAPARSTSRCSTRPTPTSRCPRCARPWRGGRVRGGGRGGQRAHPRRRHLPGRAGPALRPRPRRRPVRRLPGAAPGEPEPVHVLRAPPRGHAGRRVARADGAAARRPGHLPARSPAPATGAAPRRRTAGSAPSCASTRRRSPSTSMLVDLARNDVGPGRALRHREGRRDVDPRALQPRDAPHVAGVGRAGRGPHADRRAAGHAAGRHGVGRAEGAGDGDHRRARADQARALRRASSATSTSAATSTPPSPSARWSAGPTARASVQAGAGIVADSVRGPRGPRVPQQGQGPARRRAGRPAHDRRPPQRRHAACGAVVLATTPCGSA